MPPPPADVNWSTTWPSDANGRGRVDLTDERGRPVAGLAFDVCGACRSGRIRNVWVAEPWQRQGLARDLVHTAIGGYGTDYAWTTTWRSRSGRAFFAALTDDTGTRLIGHGGGCGHYGGRWRRTVAGFGLFRRPMGQESSR